MALEFAPGSLFVVSGKYDFLAAAGETLASEHLYHVQPNSTLGKDLFDVPTAALTDTVWVIDPRADAEIIETVETVMVGRARLLGHTASRFVNEQFRIIGSPRERVEALAARLSALSGRFSQR